MDFPTPPDVEVYDYFCRGRFALIEALTTDLDKFLAICDPEKDRLCLYGDASSMSWEVTFPPPDDVPPPAELHRPAPGVFFKRDKGMSLSEWLLQIALHCDTWLKSVASHRGARLDPSARRSLIARINRCPTVVDAVAKHMRDIFGWNDESEITGQDNEEHKACGSCSGSRKSEFWIKCDRCGTLYHGDCMQITPRMDKKIGKYRCPYCGPRG